MCDEEMELAVPFREESLVAHELFGVAEHRLHVVEIAPRRMQDGKPRGEGSTASRASMSWSGLT